MGKEQLPDDFAAAELHYTAVLERWKEYLLQVDQEEAAELAPEIVDELDEAWPYTGMLCLFDGRGLLPVVDENDTIGIQQGNVSGMGRDNGFMLYDINGDGRIEICHSFLLQEIKSIQHPCIIDDRKLFAYVDTDAVVRPAAELESALVPELFAEQVEGSGFDFNLEKASDWLVALYRSTSFRRMNQRDQERLVRKHVQMSEFLLDARHAQVTLAARYCCRAVIQPNGVEHEFVPLNNSVVVGNLLGLGTLEEQRLTSRPIRRDSDMVERSAGLCMIVEVTEASEPLDLRPQQIIYLPLSSQRAELTIDTTVSA